MSTPRIPVRPAVMVWARATARLAVDDAAKSIGVSAERLRLWENDESQPGPTVKQLRSIAAVYNRPLAALFLVEPPIDDEVFDLPDFRRGDYSGQESISLRRAMLRARRQQDAVAEIVEDGADAVIPTPALISLNPGDSPEVSGTRLRAALDLDGISHKVVNDPEVFLRTLVRLVETRGYMVIQVQRVSIDEMRGFSSAEGHVPLIALNGADWPRGKVYTLLHELVHIGVRESGLCDLSRESTSPVERYCDAVAAAALMPAAAFEPLAQDTDPTQYESLRVLAGLFGVSSESALLRMVGLKLATWDQYFAMKGAFRDAYSAFKSDQKESGDPDAPIFYQLKVRDLGRSFIGIVLRAHDDGAISSRDVSNLLEVSYDKVPKLARASGITN